jgi:dTDP-D-glucose 4,6-dehydratase
MSPLPPPGTHRQLVTGGAASIDAASGRHQLLILAAESHATDTFQLFQSVLGRREALPSGRQQRFCLHHISINRVSCSLGATERVSETTPYDPRSLSSASKAASDHLMHPWPHTYGLPVVHTNVSSNDWSRQFPKKPIPMGANVRGRAATA